ncbi:hypothetical protein [Paracoccus alkanivorans]|nr:hypothetical protein [Paracoccus alkanivorans]
MRSRITAAVAQRGTRPEMTVRRLCHALGYRYRRYVNALLGAPDLTPPVWEWKTKDLVRLRQTLNDSIDMFGAGRR